MEGSYNEMEYMPSMRGRLLIGSEVEPQMVALVLPLEVAPSVTRLRGAITDLEKAFMKKVKGRKILSVRTQIAMKALKYRG